MYRMMRLSQKKKEIIESAGMKFRWSFFDLVFEIVRVERYEKILHPKSPEKKVERFRELIQQKLNILDVTNPSLLSDANDNFKPPTE
jgi:hypothetical protein